MKNWIKHITVGFFISILLVSSLGISINTVYCFCTKTQHVSLLEEAHVCFKQHEDPEIAAYVAKLPPCCQKAMAQSCQKSDKDCTQKTKKIVKADLKFTADKAYEGLFMPLAEVLTYVPAPWVFSTPALIGTDVVEWPDRAPPPRSGRDLLNFIQVYRC